VGFHDGGGTRVRDTAGYPLAEFWNGVKWAHQSTTGAPHGYLTGVACESASKCEAVGTAADSASGSATLAMGLRGSTWITQSTPKLSNEFGSPPGGFEWLDTSVSCWSSGCKASGDQFYCVCSPESSGSVLFSETWNGSKWSLDGKVGRPDPPGSNTAWWTDLRCTAVSACTAVGFWTNDNEAQPLLTLISSWNGTSWSQVSSPNGSDTTDSPGNALNSLACSRTACAAVGMQTVTGGSVVALAERK